MKKGFTLLEMSIVVVIIGFIFAIITTGQKLVNNAKNNRLIMDLGEVVDYYNIFKVAYDDPPGDYENANFQFGGTNGNGNGFVDGSEDDHFFTHMELADIAPDYGYTNEYKFPSRPDSILVAASNGSSTSNRMPTSTNYLVAYGQSDSSSGWLVRTTDAYKIDKKLDDGRATAGKIAGFDAGTGNYSGSDTNCIDGDAYNVGNTENGGCTLIINIDQLKF